MHTIRASDGRAQGTARLKTDRVVTNTNIEVDASKNATSPMVYIYVWRAGREAGCISYKMNLFDPCALFVLLFALSV